MSTRILYDPEEDKAALYDSVSGTAFGPVIDATESYDAQDVAENFLVTLTSDPRQMTESELLNHYATWRHTRSDS